MARCKLKTILLLLPVILGLAVVGCSSDDAVVDPVADAGVTATADDTAEDTQGNGADDGGLGVGLEDLSIVSINFDDSTVMVRNSGGEPLDLGGYWICNRPQYGEVGSLVIEPGELGAIKASAIGLAAQSGEFGLYRSQEFGQADQLVAYVQWGEAGHGRESVAVEAGLIESGQFIDNGADNIDLSQG